MNRSARISIVLGTAMMLAGILAWYMTPIFDGEPQGSRIDLETMIPTKFDGWQIEPDTVARIVSADEREEMDKIYAQSLARTYVNRKGERVMLSIAYGGRQSTDLHVHRPEICYAAGGFRVSETSKLYVDTQIGRIPVMRLVASKGARSEPITYWVRVGDSLTRGWIEQKLAAIGYGLIRKVPDGLLFRVSTISNDEQDSYRIQQQFLDAMLLAVKNADRFWLVGNLGVAAQASENVQVFSGGR